MVDFFYEQKRIADEIGALKASDAVHESMMQKCMSAVETINELSNTTRKEGLLALEEAAAKMNDGRPYGKELARMIQLIVDGTEPSLVEEIVGTEYVMMRLTDYNALIYLIYLKGILSIQEGENPYVTAERLVAMLPIPIQGKTREAVMNYSYPTSVSDTDPRDEFLNGDTIKLSPDQEGYFIAKLVDYAFGRLDDRSIQRVFREIENEDLARLIRVQSGQTNKRVFDNLSDRLGRMIAEDALWMGELSYNKTADASGRIMNVIMKLIDSGEIISHGTDKEEIDLLEKLYILFKDDLANKKAFNEQTREQKNELAEMFKEYTGDRGYLGLW